MNKKVYIVDDDVDLVEGLKMALEADGFEVAAQHDEENLTDNIREFNPAVIILDVMFPGDDGAGFRMARTIHHHDDIKDKPLIMLSGVNQEGNFPADFSNKDIDDTYLPVTEFVEKPVDPKVLADKINALTA